jgi:flagellar hook-associated protein FlgK
LPSSIDIKKLEFIIDAYGTPESVAGINSGKIGGLVGFRDQVLSPAVDSLNSLATAMVREINSVHTGGVDSEGQLGGDLFGFTAGNAGQASAMTMVIQDANRVAAAGQFRVIDAPLNSGTAQARVSFNLPVFGGATELLGDLALAQVPQTATIGVNISANQGFASLGLIPIGTQDLSLTLQAPSSGQTLQVLSRDGRHLVGSTLTDAQQTSLLTKSHGIETGATYSDAQLNGTHPETYLGLDIFMGAKASVLELQQFNSETGAAQSALRVSAELIGKTFVGTEGNISDGALTLNGQELPPLDGPFTLDDVVNWLNAAAVNHTSTNGITASAVDGKLVLSRPSTNTTDDIRLGLGNGTPADLHRLGFDTTLSIEGGTPDDFLIFVTDSAIAEGVGFSNVNVSAQFASVNGDLKQSLRKSELLVNFSSDTEYTISDTTTGSVLAARSLVSDGTSSTSSLSYRGLKLEFSTAPKTGDQFTIDANRDGIGNNEAMLQLVALEDERLMPGGLTLTEAYIERVNQVGNVARQAAISEQALRVVYRQAQEARDNISGVSLDEEASALVRFQQAYQANAKVMQTAMSMFDTILQVR